MVENADRMQPKGCRCGPPSLHCAAMHRAALLHCTQCTAAISLVCIATGSSKEAPDPHLCLRGVPPCGSQVLQSQQPHGHVPWAEVTLSGLPDARMTQGPLIVQRTPTEASNCTSRQFEATVQKVIQEAQSCLSLWRCVNVVETNFQL